MRSTRVIAVATAIAVTGLGLVGCTSDDGGSPEIGELRLGIDEPASLIPADATRSQGAAEVLRRLYVGLYTYNPDGTLEPVIAESRPRSKDSKTWTIEISDGWKFHNGEKITADTFVKSWNFAAYGPNANSGAESFSRIDGFAETQGDDPEAERLSGLEAVDDHTLRITLADEFVGFPVTLGNPVFSPLADACLDDVEACDDEPIGNGPYEMDGEWKHKRSISLKRWPDFNGRKPAIEKTHFTIYPGDATAYSDFDAGTIGIVDIPDGKYAEAETDYGDAIIQEKTGHTWGLGFPLWEDDYADPDVRKALSMAIDRKAYVDDTFQGRHEIARSWTPPIIPGFKADTCGEVCVFNQQEAETLLESTDFPTDEKLVLWSMPGPVADHTKKLGDMLERNLGLEYELRTLKWEDFLRKRADHEITGPYLTDWVPEYPLNENYLTPLYGDGPDNDFGFHDEKFEKALHAGDTAADLEAAKLEYQRAERLLADDPPVVPLWVDTTATLLGERVVADSYQRNPIVGGFDFYQLKLNE